MLLLSFLYVLEKPWGCFLLSADGRFLFYERQPFSDVYNRVNSLDFDRVRMLYIHGSFGIGKSYMLDDEVRNIPRASEIFP